MLCEACHEMMGIKLKCLFFRKKKGMQTVERGKGITLAPCNMFPLKTILSKSPFAPKASLFPQRQAAIPIPPQYLSAQSSLNFLLATYTFCQQSWRETSGSSWILLEVACQCFALWCCRPVQKVCHPPVKGKGMRVGGVRTD